MFPSLFDFVSWYPAWLRIPHNKSCALFVWKPLADNRGGIQYSLLNIEIHMIHGSGPSYDVLGLQLALWLESA